MIPTLCYFVLCAIKWYFSLICTLCSIFVWNFYLLTYFWKNFVKVGRPLLHILPMPNIVTNKGGIIIVNKAYHSQLTPNHVDCLGLNKSVTLVTTYSVKRWWMLCYSFLVIIFLERGSILQLGNLSPAKISTLAYKHEHTNIEILRIFGW